MAPRPMQPKVMVTTEDLLEEGALDSGDKKMDDPEVVDPDNLDFSQYQPPMVTSHEEVQDNNKGNFLGFMNFYQWFIAHFAHISKPLTSLVKLTEQFKKFELPEEAQQAFHKLIQAFMTAGVLRHFNYHLPTRLETDVSDFTIAGVLKKGHEGQWHPLAYYSQKLSSAEKNYEIHDKELLAIVACLPQWRHMLTGLPSQLVILTDHEALKHFGVPDHMVSDCGRQFISKAWKEFASLMGAKHSLSTAYHPQMYGQTEQVNQVVEQYLQMYCNYQQDDWAKLLQMEVFVYNNTVHTSIGVSLFFACYGWNPKAHPDIPQQLGVNDPKHPEYLVDGDKQCKYLQEQIRVAQCRMVDQYNRKHKDIEFKEGDNQEEEVVVCDNLPNEEEASEVGPPNGRPEWQLKERPEPCPRSHPQWEEELGCKPTQPPRQLDAPES
ncbi:uncharacterized protein UBRO2_01379 [Ustilago bromivora]|uniref:Integrase catalytic domain-containing protein n=1 Tax=Ustilago bromivora TaxID=307758 RepID=A0A8H8TQZ8_9BASI|nr:uncharacterized protein UBRO2_01379 [Ustilago bromivora]